MQKSLREGFGLTVSEALWKGRPVVGGRCRRDHAADPRRLRRLPRRLGRGVPRQRTIDLLADPVGADAHGRAGPGARARQLPLDPRARGLAAALHRALRVRRDRRLEPRPVPVLDRGRRQPSPPTAAPVASPARCTPSPRPTDVLDGASLRRGRDQRRRPRRLAAARRDADARHSTSVCSTLDPHVHRCTTTSSRTACCGSCFHGLFDLTRRPRFDDRVPRGVGRVRRGQPGVRRRSRSRRAATATSCSCRTTSSRSCRACCATSAARPAHRRTSRTRRSAVRTRSACCPTDVADALCASLAAVPVRVPHRALGQRVRRASRARGARRRADATSTFAAPLGPDPDALRRDTPRPTPRPRRAAPSSTTRSATASVIFRIDRIEPSKNIVRGLPRVRPSARRHRPEWRERVVFVAMLDRVAREPARVPRVPQGGRAGGAPA